MDDDDGREVVQKKEEKSPKWFGHPLWGDRLDPMLASGVVKWLPKIVVHLKRATSQFRCFLWSHHHAAGGTWGCSNVEINYNLSMSRSK
jgi:hypothetical protein